MYVWIWRTLPGNWAAKLAGVFALLAVVITVLMLVVFPWAEPRLPWNNVTVDQPSGTDTVQHSGLGPAWTLSPAGRAIIPLSTGPRA